MTEPTDLEATKVNPEAPNPQLPIVQRLRIRYTKRGRLRFTSHRDFGRAFERALRRAETPIAFSSGYSPHPKISYAGASPTGAASEAEFVEIGLTRRCDPEQIRGALDEALPEGLDLVDIIEAPDGSSSLADRLEASEWEITLDGISRDEAAAAVAAFLAAPSIQVDRTTKKGLRTFDCRAAVTRLSSAEIPGRGGQCAILTVVIRHGTPSVRPDDVLAGLRMIAGLEPPVPPLASRSAQGPLDSLTGTVGDPLAPDRDASRQEKS